MSGSPPPGDGRRDVGNGVSEKCYGARGGGPSHKCYGALTVFAKRIADVDPDRLSPHWVRVVVIESASKATASNNLANNDANAAQRATRGDSSTRGQQPPQPPHKPLHPAADPPQLERETGRLGDGRTPPPFDFSRLGRHGPPFPGATSPAIGAAGKTAPPLPPHQPQSPAWPVDGDEVLRRALSRRWAGADLVEAGSRAEPDHPAAPLSPQSPERQRRSQSRAEREAVATAQRQSPAAETARTGPLEPRPPVERSITPGAPGMTAVANLRQAINTAVTTAVQTVRDPEFGKEFVNDHVVFIKGTLEIFFSGEPIIQAVKYSGTVLSGVAASTSKLASYTYEKGKTFFEENYK